MLQRALAIHEQSLRPQHPHTQQGRRNYVTLLHAMGRNAEAEQLMQVEYNAVFSLLQQLIYNIGDTEEHDDENKALLRQLQQMLGGRDNLLEILQELRGHIDDTKYDALLMLAQQTLGFDDGEAEQAAPDDDETEAAEQLEEQQ